MKTIRSHRPDNITTHNNKGLTLIELLVAMAITSIALAAIITIYSALTRSYTTESARATVQQDIRSAMELMCHDIRHAGLDPYDRLPDGFVVAFTDNTSIQFISDLNYNGQQDANELIRYFRNGRQLLQQLDASPPVELLGNVTNLNFTFLPNAENTANAVVQITLAVQTPAGREGMVTRTLTEQVRLRNQL